jgi:hypothetical protein|nr:MAG TPA: hypothetical protein [Caudoviricetes sp.]
MITANGKTFECSFFGVSTAGNMHVVVSGASVMEIADFFSQKGNLETIQYDNNGEIYEYTGFVKLLGIAIQDDGIRVTLRRLFAGEEE